MYYAQHSHAKIKCSHTSSNNDKKKELDRIPEGISNYFF